MVPPGSVLVLIPAYNEEAQIGEVLAAIRATEPDADIAVIDDGSTDQTPEIARSAGAIVIQHPYNMGYGSALQTGYKFAWENGYQYLAQIDADGQHDPIYILDMLDILCQNKADVVIGSRFLIEKGYRAPFAKKMGMIIFGTLASWIMRQKISDPTSGYQALNRKAFRYCAGDVYPSDFADADVTIMLHRAGLRVKEVPVKMYPSVNKESRYLNMYSIFTPFYYIFKMSLSIFVCLLRKPGSTEEVFDS